MPGGCLLYIPDRLLVGRGTTAGRLARGQVLPGPVIPGAGGGAFLGETEEGLLWGGGLVGSGGRACGASLDGAAVPVDEGAPLRVAEDVVVVPGVAGVASQAGFAGDAGFAGAGPGRVFPVARVVASAFFHGSQRSAGE